MLGVFATMAEYGAEAGLVAGYGAIKRSALLKFERLGIPIHRIAHYRQIYDPARSEDPLKNFFDPSDPPIPVYYTQKEVASYSRRMFDNERLFRRVGPNVWEYRPTALAG